MHQCGDSCLRDRNRKTRNPSINANGVVAVAFFGMATAIRISLMVPWMTRARLHALAPRAERSFIWLKCTTHTKDRDMGMHGEGLRLQPRRILSGVTLNACLGGIRGQAGWAGSANRIAQVERRPGVSRGKLSLRSVIWS